MITHIVYLMTRVHIVELVTTVHVATVVHIVDIATSVYIVNLVVVVVVSSPHQSPTCDVSRFRSALSITIPILVWSFLIVNVVTTDDVSNLATIVHIVKTVHIVHLITALHIIDLVTAVVHTVCLLLTVAVVDSYTDNVNFECGSISSG